MRLDRFDATVVAAVVFGVLLVNSSFGDLVAHYPLDVDPLDASGNGYNGAVVGGTVNFGQPGANGNTGTSASFPNNGHIDVPWNSALNPTSFTVTLWANPSAAGGGQFRSPITSRDESSGASVREGYIIYNNNVGNWSFWTGNGAAAWPQTNGTPVAINDWTHVAISFDESTNTKTLYIDGLDVASDSGGALYQPSSVQMEDLHIGSGADSGNSFHWVGLIDDVGIFNEALSEEEIQEIMNDGVASFAAETVVPEPASIAIWSLLGCALAGFGYCRIRRS